ncbi:TPA: accessory Sec system protein translocase subunit SecY2 [Staphylococcus delphini]|nr:accessory Sec system protein translocase subunit SecY2 [Staphylococcus delphini]HEC2178947.1 accessory Sec system protein translocase subunit SecY2 [Staphylococcus delphini]HEC2183639.1 accessory Sec system protein translocase subunit SecY2 [Staphylococcus delphini]HEC2186920.1 accessory Sec system protein translocase subunit SecY2 [Staphylococcus delphini]HEC2200702.1 accessory Sec system protein translocase subunit SecY2 [Staphylococcus delphini]
MRNNVITHIFKRHEYKILHKRILFTFFILLIYILGSRVAIVGDHAMLHHESSFYKLAVSNMGGDIHRLNVFSLGLGPWLTAMIIISLLSYKNMEKAMHQTRSEKHYKEKFLTLGLSVIQGYFVLHQFVRKEQLQQSNEWLLLLILITGAMLMVWLADQNVRYGIAGPMPIVMISVIRSMFTQKVLVLPFSKTLLLMIIVLICVMILTLLLIELIEYRTHYRDITEITRADELTYLAWKINPGGSLSIMISLSVFVFLNSVVGLIVNMVNGRATHIQWLSFNHAIGITIYIIMQLILGYLLSRLMINTKQSTKNFLKSGHYFVGVKPGEETGDYLNQMARRICWFGTAVVAVIIGVPLYISLLVPDLSEQIYFAVQFIIMVYLAMNMTETLKTYLYFEKYGEFLNKYW